MHSTVFITGGTGYLGHHLLPLLIARGYPIVALVRPGSEAQLPAGARAVVADALRAESFQAHIPSGAIFIQLLGVRHPSPAKAGQFRSVDLLSVRASVAAAKAAGVAHFVYLSVAQPAPVMRAYQEVRAEGENLVRAAALPATFLRPWYILGPGHRWPWLLQPVYWLCECIPATREAAQRLGLVTLPQMLAALLDAVEHPPAVIREIDVPEIRRFTCPACPSGGGGSVPRART